MSRSPRLQAVIADLVIDCQGLVDSIEAKPFKTTQFSYGDYLALLGKFEDADARNLMALALLEAGANRAGVRWALRLINGA